MKTSVSSKMLLVHLSKQPARMHCHLKVFFCSFILPLENKIELDDSISALGVRASEHMANTDLKEMTTYKDKIMKVGAEFKIDPALIAGIISRESRAGKALKDGGWGDWDPTRGAYNAFGLMQVALYIIV